MASTTDFNQTVLLSKGRALEGSKASIQQLVNTQGGSALNAAIRSADQTCEDIIWRSPLQQDAYRECSTNDLFDLLGTRADLSFWPQPGPQWDAVGMDKETLILVEAKSHISETRSKMGAIATKSQELIRNTMRRSHKELMSLSKYSISSDCPYDEAVWENRYYQLANRLSFFAQLNEQGIPTKLILVNFVNDPTWAGTIQSTSKQEFEAHYRQVFMNMLGSPTPPAGVILVYL